jgi:hypothetical protein
MAPEDLLVQLSSYHAHPDLLTNQPIRHVRPYVQQRRQSAQRWHNCCCWCHQVPKSLSELQTRILLCQFSIAYFDVVISHSNVICVGLEIFWSSHDCEVDGPLVAKCLVRPFSY